MKIQHIPHNPQVFICIIVILCIMLSATSCSTSKQGEYLLNQKVIADEGALLVSSDGRISLEIPSGALRENTRISVSEVPEAGWTEEIRTLDPEGPVYRFEPDGLVFNEPVTLEMQLEPDDISSKGLEAGIPAYLLVSVDSDGEQNYLFDPVTKVSFEDESMTITGELIHFSWIVRQKALLEVGLLQVERKQVKDIIFEPSIYYKNVRERHFPTTSVIRLGITLSVSNPLSTELDKTLIDILDDGEQRIIHPFVKCIDDKGIGVYTLKVQACQEVLKFRKLTYLTMVLDGVVECVPPPPTTGSVQEPPSSTPTPTPEPAPTPAPTTPKKWEVYIEYMDGIHICDPSTGICNFNVMLRVVGDDPVPMEGASVTLKMTGPDIDDEIKSEITDMNGEVTVEFKAPHGGVYHFEVIDISGKDMEYHPDKNLTSAIDIH